MSQLPLAAPTASANTWHMYRSMVGIGLLCGLIIVGVFEWTRPIIARNKAAALQRAIFQVLPAARSSTTFRFEGESGFEALEGAAGEGARLVFAAYDEQDGLVGVAVEAEGMGYQDVIRLLYGYSFAEQGIVGIRVLDSRETPGLGDRIETDPAFLANFERLDVSLSADGSGIAHPIEFVKRGGKQQAWQIDGITGATISSRAITEILRRSTADWIPALRRNVDDFRKVEQP